MCRPDGEENGQISGDKKGTTAAATAQQQQQRPPSWKVWTIASRPHTLTASVSPVIVGQILATKCVPSFSPNNVLPTSIAFACFAALIQLGTNLHNDYADYVKGADTHKRVGHARATQRGWLTPFETATASTLCLVGALLIGFHLSFMNGDTSYFDPIMVFVVLSSTFNAVAYTGGPFPLGYVGLGNVSIGYSGLGDLFVFLYFGVVATVTVPYLIVRRTLQLEETQQQSLNDVVNLFWGENAPLKASMLISFPIGFLATAIIVVNNLRDRKTDVEAKKLTTAVRFGETFAHMEYATLILLSYVFCILCALFPNDTMRFEKPGHWMLLPLLSMPLAVPQFQAVALGGNDGGALNVHVGGTARVQLVFCLLLAMGIGLSVR